MRHPTVLKMILPLALAATCLPASAQAPGPHAEAFQEDARSFADLVNERYAYLDRFDDHFELTPKLEGEIDAIKDDDDLLRFLERAVALLADHHAITGSSFATSWALVPSRSDIWAEAEGSDWVVAAVRENSPAEGMLLPGDRIVSIDGIAPEEAVAAFWSDLGVDDPDGERRSYAMLTLLAGRRNEARRIGLERYEERLTVALPTLYTAPLAREGTLTATEDHGRWTIRINDSLGDSDTIAAFDEAMAAIPDHAPVTLDLRDTGSGGNTTIARAILGWFVSDPSPYQVHSLPGEYRYTGIARKWVELVLPREGKQHSGPLAVRVGRWTGSMGEGLAVGFDALGYPVCGDPMAGLLGGIYDLPLANSGQVFKIPVEKLDTVGGLPREDFRPLPESDPACTP